jgi:restriction endonuclease Mrr
LSARFEHTKSYDPNSFEDFFKKRLIPSSPAEVERIVAEMFSRVPGSTAYATPEKADFGADVIATDPNGEVFAIQVKHYPNKNVGNDSVQQVIGSMRVYKAKHAIVITTGPGFTELAKTQAKHGKVRLWAKKELKTLHGAVSQGTLGSLSRLKLEYSAQPGWLLFLTRLWRRARRVDFRIWVLVAIGAYFLWINVR